VCALPSLVAPLPSGAIKAPEPESASGSKPYIGERGGELLGSGRRWGAWRIGRPAHRRSLLGASPSPLLPEGD
jgi:hypothetical protein